MIEPASSPALRVHSSWARSMQRPVQWQTGDLSRKAPWSGCTRVRLTANGAEEMSGLEEKQASAATPARQNLNFIYGEKNTQTSAANASRADSQPSLGDGGATTNTGSDEEEMSEADQLRQRLAQGQGPLSAGEIPPTGDPFRAMREQWHD